VNDDIRRYMGRGTLSFDSVALLTANTEYEYVLPPCRRALLRMDTPSTAWRFALSPGVAGATGGVGAFQVKAEETLALEGPFQAQSIYLGTAVAGSTLHIVRT
jgi:hypothetical protein